MYALLHSEAMVILRVRLKNIFVTHVFVSYQLPASFIR